MGLRTLKSDLTWLIASLSRKLVSSYIRLYDSRISLLNWLKVLGIMVIVMGLV
jgi:hypothetical protein